MSLIRESQLDLHCVGIEGVLDQFGKRRFLLADQLLAQPLDVCGIHRKAYAVGVGINDAATGGLNHAPIWGSLLKLCFDRHADIR